MSSFIRKRPGDDCLQRAKLMDEVVKERYDPGNGTSMRRKRRR